jgi:methylthioribulose-1-phosphate dehydratase
MRPQHFQIFYPVAESLTQMIHFCAGQGWCPATSTNFSARLPKVPGQFAITRTGLDKRLCTPEDIMLINQNKEVDQYFKDYRPSAETDLHLALYDFDASIGSVAHSHSVNATFLSQYFFNKKKRLFFEGWELNKAFSGVSSHYSKVELPIFPNTQDMFQLGIDVVNFLKDTRQFVSQKEDHHQGAGSEIFKEQIAPIWGVLIAGHGIYAWGEDISSAQRHLEAYEFLLALKLKELQYLSNS